VRGVAALWALRNARRPVFQTVKNPLATAFVPRAKKWFWPKSIQSTSKKSIPTVKQKGE
jgi:hypothetical protein